MKPKIQHHRFCWLGRCTHCQSAKEAEREKQIKACGEHEYAVIRNSAPYHYNEYWSVCLKGCGFKKQIT